MSNPLTRQKRKASLRGDNLELRAKLRQLELQNHQLTVALQAQGKEINNLNREIERLRSLASQPAVEPEGGENPAAQAPEVPPARDPSPPSPA